MLCLKPFGEWLIVPMLSMAALLASGSDAPLADAAEKMDRTSIRKLLQHGIDVNAPQVDGTTALHWAAYQDDLETMKLLVDGGADVTAANRYGVTALSLACTNGNVAMVELLLEVGADPNTTLRGGETALMTAARTGKPGLVKALLSRGADVGAKVGRGQTALMWAAAEGHVEVVEELIHAGADFRTPLPDSGITPLFFAVREGRGGVVQTLLKAGVDVNETVQPGPKPLAYNFHHYRGPKAGSSPLILAVENGHFELASALLEAGADPNDQRSGFTALHTITWVRKPGRGDGGDPAPQGSGNMSSLQFVRKLVAQGADVNAKLEKGLEKGMYSQGKISRLGATPFLLAAITADTPLMRTLVELGADPLLPNAENCTSLMAAAGVGTSSPGEVAGTEPEVLEAVQLLLDLGVDLNAVDDNGETAMHGAAYKNLPKVVQFLADKGARIEIWNQKNKYGWRPLLLAEGHRFGNFKFAPETVAALHRVMIAAGVSPPTKATHCSGTFCARCELGLQR